MAAAKSKSNTNTIKTKDVTTKPKTTTSKTKSIASTPKTPTSKLESTPSKPKATPTAKKSKINTIKADNSILETKKEKTRTYNNSRFGLITDSSNSITPEEAQKLGISILSFSITRLKGSEIEVFEDKTNDRILSEIYNHIDNDYKYNTSTIPLGLVENEIKKLFKKHEYIIFVPVSKGLSNQFDQLEALTNVYPNLIVLDTESSAYVNEYILLQVHELVTKSNDVDSIELIQQIKNLVNDIKLRSTTFFAIKDISGSDGGRIPKSFTKILKLAKVSPIVELNFKNKSADFTRNWDEISKKIVELVNKRFDGLLLENIIDIVVVHAQAEQKYIDFLLTTLVNSFHIEPSKIKVKLMPTSISIHTRKNALGIAIITNKYKNNI